MAVRIWADRRKRVFQRANKWESKKREKESM